MTLILFAIAFVVAMFAVVFLYGVLRSILRGLKWLLVVVFTGKRPVKKATPVSTARPYRRDYSYVLDSTPSPLNPYFSDVLDAEAAGWSFEYGGYIDDPETFRRRRY